MDKKIYGIDLGTTYSAIAVYEDEEAKIIPNIDGMNTTPSVIYFNGTTSDGDDEMIVGQEAKNAAGQHPNNVVQFVKRDMGVKDEKVNRKGPSGKTYTPEMLSSFILRKLCQDASQRVDGEVKDVVITVPAYFDDARRTATKQAGAIAGLNVLAVLNEPTAAAIAFGLGKGKDCRALVYDLGGGTFDVTIMDIHGNSFDVIATGGDSKLGGFNFDAKMAEIIRNKLTDQGFELDINDDAMFADIREKAERAKRMLSDREITRLHFTHPETKKDYSIEISRTEFEAATENLITMTRVILENTMQGMPWSDIDEVLLVGGSTKMPMVKRFIEDISKRQVSYKVDPDTAVAKGAAIFASTFDLNAENGVPQSDARVAAVSENEGEVSNRIIISDVTSQSLGVVTYDKQMKKPVNTIIIPHNTKIPTKMSETVYTMDDNQTKINVRVTEGDDEDINYVKIIGESMLSIPPYPKDSPVEIIYAYDPDQTVSIEVIDKVTNQSLGTFEIDRSSNMSAEEVVKATEISKRTYIE